MCLTNASLDKSNKMVKGVGTDGGELFDEGCGYCDGAGLDSGVRKTWGGWVWGGGGVTSGEFVEQFEVIYGVVLV